MKIPRLSQATTVSQYRRTLTMLTVVTTAIPLLLFALALRENLESSRIFHEVASCAYLRSRTLLLYCETQNDAAIAPPDVVERELKAMDAARASLRRDYPIIIGRSDADWALYSGAVGGVGQVDWATTQRLYTDFDNAVTEIREQAYQQDHSETVALYAALGGMLVSIVLSCVTLRGLASADAKQTLLTGVLDATSDAVSIVDAKFDVLYGNRRYRRLLGVSESEAISTDQNNAHFAPETLRRMQAGPVPGEEESGVWKLDGDLVSHDGKFIPVSLVLITLKSPDGALLGYAEVSRDVSREKAAEAELRSSRERLEQAQSLARVGSWELDLRTGQLDWSNEMRRIADFALEEALPDIEGFLDRVHSGDRDRIRALLARVVSDGIGYDAEYRFVHKNSENMFVRSRCEVTHDAAGAPLALVGATMDITEAKLAEQEYRRLASIVESTDQMITATTLDGVFVSWNRGAERLYGYAASDVIGRHASFLSPGNPDFLAQVTEQVLRGELVENVEVVRTRKDGVVIDVSLNFSPVFDSAGQMVAVAAMGRDITERKRAEEALRASQEQLAAAQRAARLGSWSFDAITREIKWSEELFHLLGFDPANGEPPLADVTALYHPDELPSHEERLAKVLRDGIGYTVDARLHTVQGELRWMQITAKSTTDETGRVVQLIGTMLDITSRKNAEEKMRDYAVALEFKQAELERTNEQLARLATQDGLTHLKNHRAFQERLAEEIERAHRYGTPLSLMLIDVDQFKQYNDAFGHPAGDVVLKKVAEMMELAARQTDVVARYGGEEFVIVLPQTDSGGGAVVAERVRAAIEAAEWPNRDVTVSIGLCSMTGASLSQSALISGADEMLYESKRGGRNRVTVYQSAQQVMLRAA